MRVVVDIETNALVNPTKLWCVVFKDIDTGEYHIFRNVTENGDERERLLRYLEALWSEPNCLCIGHNLLDFDLPVLNSILELRTEIDPAVCFDTLILSRLVDYSRDEGHSIEAYGLAFGIEKIDFTDFTRYSKQMETYCVRDVDICHRIYQHYSRVLSNPQWRPAILLEHQFQLIVNDLGRKGFAFNTSKAEKLLAKIKEELDVQDKEIGVAFPPRLALDREVLPKLTRFGTLNKSDFRWIKGGDLSEYNGGPFCKCIWKSFNPSSHKQIVDEMHAAGWNPTAKTRTHSDLEREQNKAPTEERQKRLDHLRKYGWKVNEENLATLPASAPKPARTLARRILLESRRRTLTEWLGLCDEDGRIHGVFRGIGTWTHRMSHQKPNTANIPNEVNGVGKPVPFGKEMRALWHAPRKRLLVGVDAEGIQLRVFAHYIDDKEFTESLAKGDKHAGTDPHSLNKRILGSACKNRYASKRFIFALLLGAGIGKLAEILECDKESAQNALDRLMERYQGFNQLKKSIIPADAKRGWFYGLDGRRVCIPDETVGGRRHLAMSGYLQNGEAIIIKTAAVQFVPLLKQYDSFLVDVIHDEYQTETPNNMEIALQVAKIKADAIKYAGEHLKLKCPLSGSYWNEDKRDYTIGPNWSLTH